MKRGRGATMGFWALTIGLATLLLWPLVRVIGGGFFVEGRFTLRYLLGVFRNPVYAEGLLASARIGLGTTMLAMALAVPLSWLSVRYDFPGRRAWSGLLLLPMILPPFVGAIGIQQMLGVYGAVNALLGLGPVDWLGRGRYWGVIVLQALALYPVLYLNVSAALANVDPAMEEAAASLGCPPGRRFLRITFPLIMPGIFAGATLVFVWSFTELGTPLMLNYSRCAPVQVYDALKDIQTNPLSYALVLVMLATSMTLYLVGRVAFGRQAWAAQSKATVSFAPRRLRGWRAVLATVPFAGVVTLALLPHVGVALTSFAIPGSWYRSVLPDGTTLDHYREALSHSMTLTSIRNSLLYAGLAVTLNIALGVSIAWMVVRSSVRFRGLLDSLAMLPLAVPGLVMAFGYLAISSDLSNLAGIRNRPFWLAVFDVRTNPTFFLVIAYAVRRLPYMVRAAVAGLQQTSVTFEEAAANLGASAWSTLRRITLPLIMANVVAGAVLAFAFSMLEVSDSLMLAQRADHYPITKTIYELFQLIGTGRYVAAAMGVWAMAFLGVTLLTSSLLLGRRLGALFRV